MVCIGILIFFVESCTSSKRCTPEWPDYCYFCHFISSQGASLSSHVWDRSSMEKLAEPLLHELIAWQWATSSQPPWSSPGKRYKIYHKKHDLHGKLSQEVLYQNSKQNLPWQSEARATAWQSLRVDSSLLANSEIVQPFDLQHYVTILLQYWQRSHAMR